MNNIYKEFINFNSCEKKCDEDSIEPSLNENIIEVRSAETIENDFWRSSGEEDILDLKCFCIQNKNNLNEIKEKYKNELIEKIDSFFSVVSDIEQSMDSISFPTLHDFKEIAYSFFEVEEPESKGYITPLFTFNYNKMISFFFFCDSKTKDDILNSCRYIFYSSLESDISLPKEVNKRMWFRLLKCYIEYGRTFLSGLTKDTVIRKFKENFGITVWHDGYTYVFPFDQENKRKFSEKVEEEMYLVEEEMEI